MTAQAEQATADAPREWRCFHCDEVFTDREAAADHFGVQIGGLADDCACRLNATDGLILKMLREAQQELRRYHEEDTAMIREVYALGAEHHRVAREQEEKGYARGLRDAKHEVERAEAADRDKRQQEVADWCAAAFGADHANSIPQRGVRLLEEAIELYQAAGGAEEMARRLVTFVFARPFGAIGQEVGGVSLTLLALCQAAGISAEAEEVREFARVLAKPLSHFKARNDVKDAAGFRAISVNQLLCEDCPPTGYPTDATRCAPCPRRTKEAT